MLSIITKKKKRKHKLVTEIHPNLIPKFDDMMTFDSLNPPLKTCCLKVDKAGKAWRKNFTCEAEKVRKIEINTSNGQFYIKISNPPFNVNKTE